MHFLLFNDGILPLQSVFRPYVVLLSFK